MLSGFFRQFEFRALIGLGTLITLLYLSMPLGWFSTQLDNPGNYGRDTEGIQFNPTVVAIFVVALFGFTAIFLQKRCRSLQASRSFDKHAALHDPLTGAANRRHFEEFLEQLLIDQTAEHALMMIDLDRFKPVNDLYGHAAGDALLKEIAAGIQRLVGSRDLVARLGGDEFVLVLRDTTSDAAERTALAVLDFVTELRLNWQGQRISVGTSIGLVGIDRVDLTISNLLRAADEALYAAKETGRGAAFSARMHADLTLAPAIHRIDQAAGEPVLSARSHEPRDGRRPTLYGTVMAWAPTEDLLERERRKGSRIRREIAHWIKVEPLTLGDNACPGITVRDLLDDAAKHNDGGADFARWLLKMTLDAASVLSPTILGRICFVLPLPAQAAVTVPGLGDELMRINALARRPIRHLTFVLHHASSVGKTSAIEDFRCRLNSSDVLLGFEARANSLDVLAPLQHVSYDELHLGRELLTNVRPGTTGNAAIEALCAIANRIGLSVVAAEADSPDDRHHLEKMGISRIAGASVAQSKPLHDVLQNLIDG